MKLNPLTKNQLNNYIGPVIIFYGVILSICLPLLIPNLGASRGTLSINALEVFTASFIFIIGVRTFNKYFDISIQTNLSRKAYLANTILFGIILSFGMATWDTVFSKFISSISNGVSIQHTSAIMYFQGDLPLITSMLWLTTIYLTIFLFALGFAIFFRRASTGFKIFVFVILYGAITGNLTFFGSEPLIRNIIITVILALHNPSVIMSFAWFGSFALILILFNYGMIRRLELR